MSWTIRSKLPRGLDRYGWVRPRLTRLDAACLVYIDLGPELDYLARLEIYDETGLRSIRLSFNGKFGFDSPASGWQRPSACVTSHC